MNKKVVKLIDDFCLNRNLFNYLKMIFILKHISSTKLLPYVTHFVNSYYGSEFNEKFYNIICSSLKSNFNSADLYYILQNGNVYDFTVFFLGEDFNKLGEEISINDYFSFSSKQVNKVIEMLNALSDEDGCLLEREVSDSLLWKVRQYRGKDSARKIAYKMLNSIGFTNSCNLLDGVYGKMNYDQVAYLFSRIDTKKEYSDEVKEKLFAFLFENKGNNNLFRLMSNGRYADIFVDFDYFYNNLDNYLELYGNFNISDIECFVKDKFHTHEIRYPSITADIYSDMINSYFHRYGIDCSEEEVIKRNIDAYKKMDSMKKVSSIMQIDGFTHKNFRFNVLDLNDPKNLVLGYRSGNCFRINGDAATLFRHFLDNKHMRIVSISDDKHNDFAMMLLMRNGNVLISQGIEVSKRVTDISYRDLYEACAMFMNEEMKEMNNNGDMIVATVIGATNENVTRYNSNYLPFIIRPILNTDGIFYNGVSNYQCLISLSDGCSVSDMKSFIPENSYYDKRKSILHREDGDDISSFNYRLIEKQLMSFRFRMFGDNSEEYMENIYRRMLKKELCTYCSDDWFISVYDDGDVIYYLDDDDMRAVDEFNNTFDMLSQKYRVNDSIEKVYKRVDVDSE